MKNLKTYNGKTPTERNKKLFLDFELNQQESEPGKPKRIQPAPAAPVLGTYPDAGNMIPSSPAVLQGAQTIIHADNLPALAEQLREGTHNIKEVKSSETQLTIIRKKNKKLQRIATAIENPEAFIRDNVNILRLFIYAINQINRQAVSNGELTKRIIYLNPADFVQAGVYKSKHVARKEILAAAQNLKNLWTAGEIPVGKDTVDQGDIPIFDFVGNKFKNGLLTLRIHENFNWNFFAMSYTPFPEGFYSLKKRPLALAIYIQLLASNNCDRIKKTNGFNLSIKAVHTWLKLPAIEDIKNPKRDIIAPIQNAIEEIEKAVPEIDLDICNTGDGSIKDYLQGNINVMYSGYILDYFTQRADTKTEKIEKIRKRKEAREDKAIAINLAKKYAKEDQERQAATDPTTGSQ